MHLIHLFLISSSFGKKKTHIHISRYYRIQVYSAFFLTVAIGNCMVKFIPPINFCSDENIQTIFGTKLEDFLNYRIDYNSTS
jgi:hypothetical protein